MKPVQPIAIAAVVLSMTFATSIGHTGDSVVAASDPLREFAATSPATPPAAVSQGLPEAPIGHREPNARNVPAGVLHKEQTIDPSEKEFDKTLQICRRC